MTISTDAMTFHINNGPALYGSLSVDQDWERVLSSSPMPNPRWEYTDGNGHYHAYSDEKDEPYPTLERRVEHAECDGSCDGVCEGEGYHITRYFCRACKEEIEPATIPGPHTINIPGLKSWTVVVDGFVNAMFNDMVSVRIECAGEVRFGVAQVVQIDGGSEGVQVTLVGIGPLGRRKA